MITPISRKEVPRLSNKPLSERQIFAEQTVEDFFASTKVGDIVEVTDIPDLYGDAKRNTQAIRQAIIAAAHNAEGKSMRDHMKAFSRGERLFIERIEPWVPPRRQ